MCPPWGVSEEEEEEEEEEEMYCIVVQTPFQGCPFPHRLPEQCLSLLRSRVCWLECREFLFLGVVFLDFEWRSFMAGSLTDDGELCGWAGAILSFPFFFWSFLALKFPPRCS